MKNIVIKNIHFISGLILTLFIALHLFNHVCSIFGIEKHIEVMTMLRLFYRNIFIEILLLSAVLIQIFSGLILFKTTKKTATSAFEKIHIWSGLYLAFFFIMHISAVLGGRFLLHLDTNFYFGTAGLNTFPFNLFFIPYYTLAVISFFGHIAAIHNKKMKQNIFSLTPDHQSKIILLSGFCFSLVILYGFTNHFNGVEIPKEYNILIGK